MARIVWILKKKKLNTESQYLKISKYEKSSQFYSNSVAAVLTCTWQKEHLVKCEENLFWHPLKWGSFHVCLHSIKTNFMRRKKLIKESGDHRRLWWYFWIWVQRVCQIRKYSVHSVSPFWILCQHCLGNMWPVEESNHFLLKTVSMFFLTIY